MDAGRRREVRNARRLRRHQRGEEEGNDGHEGRLRSASTGGGGTSASLTLGAAQGNRPNASGVVGNGGHRVTVTANRDEAQRLSERMKQQRQGKKQADEILSQREALIQDRYAPNAMAIFSREQTSLQPTTSAAAAAAAAYAFDKDALLADLIGDNKANFLKLDRDLTEEHAIATRRLHTSVFDHASSFLLLFRDVDRASSLVEALKANVQGTKAAISSISKYSAANVVMNSSSSGTTTAGSKSGGDVFSSTLGGLAGDGDSRRLARPSLVSRRITQRYTTGNYLSSSNYGDISGPAIGIAANDDQSAVATAAYAPTWASAIQHSGAVGEDDRRTGGGMADAAATHTGVSRPTTRGLNVSSIRQWRYIIGMSGGAAARVASGAVEGVDDLQGGAGAPRRRQKGVTTDASGTATGLVTAAAKAEKEARDTAAFVDILREEVDQLLSERRHVDAAELLYRLADEATAKGCLPFLLDLEAALVSSVIANVERIPVTPVYAESLHVPLIQLLLRFGRSRTAAAVYLIMQTSWLHSEVQRLQSRVNPTCATLVAVDFLVHAIRAAVRRQHALGLSLTAARPFIQESILDEPLLKGKQSATSVIAPVGKNRTGASRPPLASSGSGGGAATTKGAGAATTVAAPSSPSAQPLPPPGSLIPPNSAALLWVRSNVERFACEVLATHLLSFGTGTDGGDPTRVRQAAQMIAQTSRVMQALSMDGFAGCDTLILRQLTPSFVILEDDFTRLTGERTEHSGRAMVEQLIMGSLAFYESHAANAASIAAAAEAAAAYAAAVAAATAAAAAAPPPSSTTTLSNPSKGAPKKNTETALSRLPMPSRPAPPPLLPPYEPLRCSDVARKVRAICQDFVRKLRMLPLSGHSLLLQVLLAPASSSLFKSTTAGGGAASAQSTSPSSPLPLSGGSPRSTANGLPGSVATQRAGGGRGGAGLSGNPNALPAIPPSLANAIPVPPLSAERFRFLRYANGCSSTQVRLMHSLCGYVAALTGTDLLPAEVVASTMTQERESTENVVKSIATMRAQQAECVAYLLTNAMVTESIDVVLSKLLMCSMEVLLRQRRGLVRFLSSEVFLTHHRRLFPKPPSGPSAALNMPFFSDPSTSPAWVLDSSLSLLSDVVAIAVWVSFFTRGSALGHMLADAQCSFRTPHLERIREDIPRLVQGWMGAVLLLNADVTHANTVLVPPSVTALQATARSTVSGRASSLATPLLAPQQSVMFGSQLPDRGDGRSAAALASKGNASASVASAAAVKDISERRSGKGGPDMASVLLSIPVTSCSAADGKSDAAATSSLFADVGIREERMLKLIMTFLDRKYCTPSNYTVHCYVIESTGASEGRNSEVSGVWALRRQLPSYPEFPIGEVREHRNDEVFLFHWCAQISLHLLTLFQERLVTPSFAINESAAEAHGGMSSFLNAGLPFPLEGCITPQEDTALAGWCAGGGNYGTALALLQFLVMRVLRDGLCRVDTWSAVYGCPVAQWRSDEAILKQQLFFFSTFAFLWAPLFTGRRTARPRVSHGGVATAGATEAATKEETPLSTYTVDSLPPLTVLEWMTCGGVLDPHVSTDSVAAAMASAALATIPPNLTAVDVLFATEGSIQLSPWGGEGGSASTTTSGAAGTGQGSGGGAALWKARTGGSGSGAQSAAGLAGATLASAAISANAVIAKRQLFGSNASYIPDGLLRVLRHFFEEQLRESRAIPAITSEVMHTRVKRAMSEINLLDFVGTSLDMDDEEDSDDDATASSSTTATAKSSAANSAERRPPSSSSSRRVTLQNLHDLIATYTLPVR